MAVSRRSFLGYAALAGMATDLSLPLSARAAQSLPRGGTLVIGSGPEATSGLTSAITSAGTAQLVSGKIFDGLLTFDEQFNPKPQLATRWEAAKDGLTLTFHLRPNVRWHDGQPFTSKDVAYRCWRYGRNTIAADARPLPTSLQSIHPMH